MPESIPSDPVRLVVGLEFGLGVKILKISPRWFQCAARVEKRCSGAFLEHLSMAAPLPPWYEVHFALIVSLRTDQMFET